ncbi:MAG: DUF58 domain-containing protein, partial [Paracoccus sp. (in: a-proteobacteria)]|nr:DUF58 domain-containing protein [Paracoccus sp. (in: a-proteobacteria)]
GQGTRKLDRARLIGLGAALLALRAGERAGWLGETPSAGRQAGFKLAARMLAGSSEPGAQWRAGDAGELSGDHDSPDAALIRPSGKHLLIGDFLGDLSGLEAALHRAASLGARGVLVQVLHPDEEDFPFQGAMRFRAPSGGGQHLTRDAAGLAAAYRARLEARRAALRDLAAGAGFGFAAHSLRHSAGEGLIGLWGALSA